MKSINILFESGESNARTTQQLLLSNMLRMKSYYLEKEAHGVTNKFSKYLLMAHIEMLMRQPLLKSKPLWLTHPKHTCNIFIPSNAYSNSNFILFSGLEIMSGYVSSLNVAQTVWLLVTQQGETSFIMTAKFVFFWMSF